MSYPSTTEERKQRAKDDAKAVREHLGDGPYKLPHLKRVLRDHRGAQRVRGDRLQLLVEELNASSTTPPKPAPKPAPKTSPAPAPVPEPPKPSNKPNPEREIQLAIEKIQRDLAHVLTRIRPTVRVMVVQGQPTQRQLKDYIDLANPATAGEVADTFKIDLTTYFQILHA